MDDRELLELAARAAGVRRVAMDAGWVNEFDGTWNPLENDGDALRLAVKLKLTVDFEIGVVFGSGARADDILGDAGSGDECMRRAITVAAAELGKAMP